MVDSWVVNSSSLFHLNLEFRALASTGLHASPTADRAGFGQLGQLVGILQTGYGRLAHARVLVLGRQLLKNFLLLVFQVVDGDQADFGIGVLPFGFKKPKDSHRGVSPKECESVNTGVNRRVGGYSAALPGELADDKRKINKYLN